MRRNALKRHGHRRVWWCAGAGRGRNWPRLGWPESGWPESVAARGVTSGRVGFARPDTWRCWPRDRTGAERGWPGRGRLRPAGPVAPSACRGVSELAAAVAGVELRLLRAPACTGRAQGNATTAVRCGAAGLAGWAPSPIPTPGTAWALPRFPVRALLRHHGGRAPARSLRLVPRAGRQPLAGAAS